MRLKKFPKALEAEIEEALEAEIDAFEAEFEAFEAEIEALKAEFEALEARNRGSRGARGGAPTSTLALWENAIFGSREPRNTAWARKIAISADPAKTHPSGMTKVIPVCLSNEV